MLRALLKAQVSAYVEHFVTKATLFSHTSTMYAGEVGTPGVISTTLRGLIEGHTLTTSQAKLLARYVAERRTLIVFGDRATGKSTLLNALFELISVDERFVSVERDAHLPALKQRSFCVRLSMDDDTDIAALFAKTEKMQPSRLVVGELHGDEILHFFDLLYRNAKVGGMATLRADSVREAVELLLAQPRVRARPRTGARACSPRPSRSSPTCAATSTGLPASPRSGASRASTTRASSCSARRRPRPPPSSSRKPRPLL